MPLCGTICNPSSTQRTAFLQGLWPFCRPPPFPPSGGSNERPPPPPGKTVFHLPSGAVMNEGLGIPQQHVNNVCPGHRRCSSGSVPHPPAFTLCLCPGLPARPTLHPEAQVVPVVPVAASASSASEDAVSEFFLVVISRIEEITINTPYPKQTAPDMPFVQIPHVPGA